MIKIHKHKIVHRDIKDDNILFLIKNENLSISFADFGVAEYTLNFIGIFSITYSIGNFPINGTLNYWLKDI